MNLTLSNVRCSFPNLFTPRAFQDSESSRYSVTAILDKKKHAKEIEEIKKAIKQVVTDHFNGNVPKGIKHCLRDGAEKAEMDGYGDDIMFVSSSTQKRPQVVDRNLSPLTAEDERVYAGCYINVSIRLWVQDNKYGKRVNAQLRAVQFMRDGDPFGEAPVKVDEVFEALDDNDGDLL